MKIWKPTGLAVIISRSLQYQKLKQAAFFALFFIIFFVGTVLLMLGVKGSGKNKLIEMHISYQENPAYFLMDMHLIWDGTVYYETAMANPIQGSELGYANDEYSTWRIFEISGYSQEYLLAVEGDDVRRVMCSQAPQKAFQQYILEYETEKQKLESMLSVTLHYDGTAILATPLISSYFLAQPYYYTFTDNELLIHYEDSEPFAIFTIVDESSLLFKSATVPLFAKSGDRYIICT